MEYTYVDSNEKLQDLCKELKLHDEIAVDLECENHLAHYGVFICLIQISTKNTNYIVDVLAIDDFSLLKEVFEDSKILKVFHDISFDLRMLYSEMNISVKNFFDTYLAARICGIEKLGLSNMLATYFDVKKESKFQKYDWTLRPIKKEPMEYAINDTLYLIELKNILSKKIEELDRTTWLEEELKYNEDNPKPFVDATFYDIKNITKQNREVIKVAKNIYDLRDKLAKKVDRPTYFLINNKRLLELAADSKNKDFKFWSSLRGVHPIVKRKAALFSKACTEEGDVDFSFIEKEKKRFSMKQRNKFNSLQEMRNLVANKLGVESGLILSKDQIKDIVLTNEYDSLRDWQKKILFANNE